METLLQQSNVSNFTQKWHGLFQKKTGRGWWYCQYRTYRSIKNE